MTTILLAAMAAQPVHVRGTIERVTPTSVVVATANGAQTLKLSAATGVAAVVPGSRSDIKPGTFIGTANIANGPVGRAHARP